MANTLYHNFEVIHPMVYQQNQYMYVKHKYVFGSQEIILK
jgi:hypothetical protein